MKAKETVSIDAREALHPEQWVKLYGIFSNRYNHIITCQIYQLETVLSKIQHSWWDDYILELVEGEE
jgi:hypothetical protein